MSLDPAFTLRDAHISMESGEELPLPLWEGVLGEGFRAAARHESCFAGTLVVSSNPSRYARLTRRKLWCGGTLSRALLRADPSPNPLPQGEGEFLCVAA